jgi:hypothetical protein
MACYRDSFTFTGTLSHAVLQIFTDVSEEHAASVFKIETWKIETSGSSVMLINIYATT